VIIFAACWHIAGPAGYEGGDRGGGGLRQFLGDLGVNIDGEC
jgi:hypothetical protein